MAKFKNKFWIPKGKKLQPWPEYEKDPTIKELQAMYEAGCQGTIHQPEAIEQFMQEHPYLADDLAHQMGIADSFAGQLVIPFVHVVEQWPGCWPGPAQVLGDCVSHDSKNTILLTTVCDVVAGVPDEKTGIVEGFPDVSPEGIAQGVFSTEAIYWFRGYNGDGWSCPDASNVMTKSGGAVIRQNYPEIGIDLTRYSASNAHKFGSNRPTDKVIAITGAHLAHDLAMVDSFEALRDLFGNGNGNSTCGGESWSNTRDENGFSKRTNEGWPHALAPIGADDRGIVKKIYGEPLVLVLNSWNKWNSGPRDIIDSAKLVPPEKKQAWIAKDIVNPATGNIMIPHGSFWSKWSDFKRREIITHSGVAGWKRKNLPNYGTFIFG